MTDNNFDTFSAMQTGKPFKTYKKTILGRVYVSAIDPFTGEVSGVMLYGDPKRGDDSCFIDMWNDREDVFFRKTNKHHFSSGYIIEAPRAEKKEVSELPIEQYSDEQLKEVINFRYLALQAKLNKITTESVLYRMVSLAREMEKSAKIVAAIEARLSEVQGIPAESEEA